MIKNTSRYRIIHQKPIKSPENPFKNNFICPIDYFYLNSHITTLLFEGKIKSTVKINHHCAGNKKEIQPGLRE